MSQDQFKELDKAQVLKVIFSKDQILHTTCIGVLSFLFAILSFLLNSAICSFISGIIYNLIWISSIINVRKYRKEIAKLEMDNSSLADA